VTSFAPARRHDSPSTTSITESIVLPARLLVN